MAARWPRRWKGRPTLNFDWARPGRIGLGLALAGLCVVTYVVNESVFLWPLFLTPLLVLLGIAGLIDPNVVRALGKYGKHLSLHYKLIAWVIMGVWFVIFAILAVVMINLGFRPGR